MTLNEEYKIRHKEYMSGKLTFEEHCKFYEWLADQIGLCAAHLPVRLNRLKDSKDPYFNDIPLHMWDNKHIIVLNQAISHGMRQWSLSNSVSCLKALARKLVRESET